MSTETGEVRSAITGGPGQPITADQYRAGLDVLTQAFRMVHLVPLDAMREYLEKVETLGPLLDPTAYMRAGDSLLDQRDVLEAAGSVMRRLARIRERMERRSS